MATTVAFYNVYDSIKITWTGGAEGGTSAFMNKKTVSFTLVNANEFYIKAGNISYLMRYSNVSAVAPSGHANVNDLVTILESWVSGAGDPSTSAEKDMMQRTRVVEPYTMFDGTFRDSLEVRKWNQLVAGGTTAISHEVNQQAAILTLDDTNASSRAILQSKKYMLYQPGKQLNVHICAIAKTATCTNNEVYLGYFDDNADKSGDSGGSGFYLKVDAADALFLVHRNYTGGVQTDTTIAQTNWNIDKLDGTGVSAVTLDTQKINNYIFEIGADGGGSMRFGVMSDNHVYYAHIVDANNTLTDSVLRTCSLPIRVENVNTGVSDAASISKVFAASVTVDGGSQPVGFTNAVDEGVASTPPHILKAVAESKPLVSIRLKAARCRTTVWPQYFQVINARDASFIRCRVVLNGTLTAPSWTSAGSDSAVEYDKSATAVVGGTTLHSVYMRTSDERIDLREVFDGVQMHADIAGVTLDTLTLVAEYISSQADLYSSCGWIEYA